MHTNKATQNDVNTGKKKSGEMPDEENNEDEMSDEAKRNISESFYMGGSTASPRSLGPSVSTEGFMLIKEIFHKISKKGKPK
jgi:hypothetical protein